MVSLDATIKYLNTQMTQLLQLNPQANFGYVLGQALESYNAKYNPRMGGTPTEMNSDFNGDVVFRLLRPAPENNSVSFFPSRSRPETKAGHVLSETRAL